MQQWVVTKDGDRDRVFENEQLALEHAVYNSSPSAPTTIRYPDHTHYTILKRHPAWKVQVVKEV